MSILVQVQIIGDQIIVFTTGRREFETIAWGDLEDQVARIVRSVAGARQPSEVGQIAEYIVVTANIRAGLRPEKLRATLADPQGGEVIPEHQSVWPAAI